MKAKIKYFISFLFALSLIVSYPLATIASNDDVKLVSVSSQQEGIQKTFTNSESAIPVIIPDELCDKISDKEIQDIIISHNLNSSNTLTIHDVVEINVDSNLETTVSENSQTREIIPPYIYKTYKTNIGDEFVDKTYFILSVAKGMELTLEQEFEKTVNPALMTGTPFASFSLGSSLTAKYSTKQVFQGPPEGSIYNSRSYYVNFYSQKYEWVQERYIYFLLEMTTSGTAKTPTRYTLYSIDSIESK